MEVRAVRTGEREELDHFQRRVRTSLRSGGQRNDFAFRRNGFVVGCVSAAGCDSCSSEEQGECHQGGTTGQGTRGNGHYSTPFRYLQRLFLESDAEGSLFCFRALCFSFTRKRRAYDSISAFHLQAASAARKVPMAKTGWFET